MKSIKVFKMNNDFQLINEGRSFHINNYGTNRLPYACISASGIEQKLVKLDKSTPEYFTVLDASGGYAFACLGASHPEIEKAIIRAIKEPGYVTDEIASFERSRLLNMLFGKSGFLTDHFPYGNYHVSGRNSGSEAVELALLLAKENQDNHKRQILVGFEGAWHGWTSGATSFLEKRVNENRTPQLPNQKNCTLTVKNLPFGNYDAAKSYFKENGDSILALIIEPIQGDAGIILPPKGYLRYISKLCENHGVILIADEILTFSRTGTFLAMRDENGAIPTDITIIGKALGMGVIPTSMVIARNYINPPKGKAIATSDLRPFTCAVIHDGIKYIIRENLLEKSLILGDLLRGLLKENVQSKYPKIYCEVRGKGFFNGIELTKLSSEFVYNLRKCLIENGVYVEFMVGVGQRSDDYRYIYPTMRISPPLIATEEDIIKIVQRIQIGTEQFAKYYLS